MSIVNPDSMDWMQKLDISLESFVGNSICCRTYTFASIPRDTWFGSSRVIVDDLIRAN